jgi:His-Xaa-Ser system protein HxsD
MTETSGTLPATTMAFDRTTVELDALQRAVYATASLMSVELSSTESEYVCSIYARADAADVSELEHRLRTEVIDQTLRLRIGRETESARNLILALAFSETGLVADEAPDS